jgi:hypothetical protein
MKAIRENYCTLEEIFQSQLITSSENQFTTSTLQFCDKHGIDINKDWISWYYYLTSSISLRYSKATNSERIVLIMPEIAITAARTGNISISEFRVVVLLLPTNVAGTITRVTYP